MDKKTHGLTEQEGNIILNESGTFISTDELEKKEAQKNEVVENDSKEQASSAGPEEKDITD